MVDWLLTQVERNGYSAIAITVCVFTAQLSSYLSHGEKLL